MKLENFLTPYIKIKWIEHLNVRLDTIQLLLENIDRTLLDTNCSCYLFGSTSKSDRNKNKNKQMGLN